MKGIKFKLKEGAWDYYDPLNQDDLSETETHYVLNMTYLYDIPKKDVDFYEWYDVCDDCGYEINDVSCRRCAKDLTCDDY